MMSSMEPVYRPVIGVALGVMKTFKWDVRTSGIEHIPTTGPAVIATNHVGYLDFVFVGAAAALRDRAPAVIERWLAAYARSRLRLPRPGTPGRGLG